MQHGRLPRRQLLRTNHVDSIAESLLILSSEHYGNRTRRRRPDYTPTAKCRGRRRTTRARAAAIQAVGVQIPVDVDIHTPTAAVGVQTPAVTERGRLSRYVETPTALPSPYVLI